MPGTYTYTIQETEPENKTAGMEYDLAGKTVTVVMDYDPDDNSKIIPTSITWDGEAVTGDAPVVVTNKYSEIKFQPEVKKAVEGEEVPSETYNFVLTDKSTDTSGESGVTTAASVSGAYSAPD